MQRLPRTGHAADIGPSSKEEAVVAVQNDDGDDGTVQASAFEVEGAGECSNVLGQNGGRGDGVAGRRRGLALR